MLSLDDVADWDGLQDCYGDVRPVLKALKGVEALPPVRDYMTEPYHTLDSALCHQGDVYTASYGALPHLVRIIESNPLKPESFTLLSLAAEIEKCRLLGRGPAMPSGLADEYDAAIKQLPSLIAKMMSRTVSEEETRRALHAIAVAAGQAALAEAILDLDPE